MNDEAAWLLAGRLALIVHLEEEREQFVSSTVKWHRHRELMDKYGYSAQALSGCPCGIGLTVVEVPLGGVKVSQIVP